LRPVAGRGGRARRRFRPPLRSGRAPHQRRRRAAARGKRSRSRRQGQGAVTAARAIAFVATAWLLLILQASLPSLLPWHAVAPEVALLVMLYIGFYGQGSPAANAGLAITIGYLTDLFSGAPRGLHALSFGLVVLAARGASHRLMVASTWQVLVVTL